MRLKAAILDLLAYLAVMQLPAGDEQIEQLLRVRTSHLAIRDELGKLEADGKVIRVQREYWGLPGIKYHNMKRQRAIQAKLLQRAERWSWLIRLIPAVKSVVVVNSVGIGNPNKNSDIDLLIVTSPRRIYLTKGLLMYGLRLLKQLETPENKSGRFSLGMFVTTVGVKWERDIMKTNEPHLLWLYALAKPVYGEGVWYGLLRRSGYYQERLPNYPWPHDPIHVYRGGLRALDWVDNVGYRRHLKHTSLQPKNHTAKAFVRIRPDIINLHALDRTTEIAEKYHKIRSEVGA